MQDGRQAVRDQIGRFQIDLVDLILGAVLRDQARACRGKPGRAVALLKAPDAMIGKARPARTQLHDVKERLGIATAEHGRRGHACPARRWAQLCT